MLTFSCEVEHGTRTVGGEPATSVEEGEVVTTCNLVVAWSGSASWLRSDAGGSELAAWRDARGHGG